MSTLTFTQKQSYEDKWEKMNLTCKLPRFWSSKAIKNMNQGVEDKNVGENKNTLGLDSAESCSLSGGRRPSEFLSWFSSLDSLSKSDASEYAASQKPPPFLRREQGVPSSIISTAPDNYCWEQEVCTRGNLCYALPSTVSLLKLRHETQA